MLREETTLYITCSDEPLTVKHFLLLLSKPHGNHKISKALSTLRILRTPDKKYIVGIYYLNSYIILYIYIDLYPM